MPSLFESSLENQIVAIFDQHGCPCRWPELCDFIHNAEKLSVREIGRKTYVLTDSAFDPQTYGLNRSFVLITRLDADFNSGLFEPAPEIAA